MERRYKVATPDVGTFDNTYWQSKRWHGTLLNRGFSVDGTPVIRVRITPKQGVGTIDIGRALFTKRNASNSPTIFFFLGRWWVRAKKSRRKWEVAKKIGSHVICGTNLTLNKLNLGRFGVQTPYNHKSSVATWIPAERKNRRDGSRTVILYEVDWKTPLG